MKQTSTAYEKHREELRQAIQQSIFNYLTKIGDEAKNLDWFAGNKKDDHRCGFQEQ